LIDIRQNRAKVATQWLHGIEIIMARPRKDAVIDLSEAQELTAGLIERLTCRTDIKAQAFLRDTIVPGLRVRVTNTGAKAFVFEAKLNRQTIRRTIGDVRVWNIEAARKEARRLAVVVRSDKADPRELDRQADADKAAAVATAAANVEAAKVATVTVGEVWAVYVAERRPHWGDLHYRDHIRKAAPGGVPYKRGTGTTEAGPLFPLLGLRLCDLTAPAIEAWAEQEAKTRQTSARLAWRMLKVFLGWCEEQPAYAGLLPAKNPAKTKKSREHFGKAGTKSDVLQKGQLAVWFAAMKQIQNPVIAAYLQTLLLVGARPGEVIAMRWEDVNTQWKGITIRDKVEGVRVIPLTPYVAHLIAALPRRTSIDKRTGEQVSTPWVFSSPTSEAGHISEPNHPHTAACTVAGLESLTLHGLRRSFKSLTEWQEIPAGVVAQIMGHKPSATAEKHYTVRPLELLALHHGRIESWILEQAGIVFDAKSAPGALRVVDR
jgi:integrase